MMDDLDAEPMSAGELKARLYQTFRERGLVESLKSQLRTKLVTELRQSAVLQQVKFGPAPSPPAHDGPSSLMLRASNSLVVDHLRRCGYDYSMAVFLPESGSAEDKVFTVPDLLDLMRITPGSKLYKKLSTELPRYDSKGFLWQLLTELSCSHGMDQRHVGVQADTHPSHQSSIERKLQSVDDAYSQQQEGDDIRNRQDIQEKLLRMRREMEAKSREETNREIMRFKESELKRVELEQREKARREIASARREIENTYQAKSEALREREQATMDRIHKHQELIEKETYSQRQSLLEELRVIKQREVDIRRESEVNSRAAKMEEEKRKASEENLRIREAAVTNIEATYEKRLREETKRFELDHEARVSQRLSELEQREAKLRAEQRGMSDERDTMKTLQKQLEGKARHIQELEDLLKQTKSETASAVNRSELLNERMRTMVDYPSLKEDNTILRRDLEHAKMRIAELSGDFKSEQSRHEELIKQLSERMSRPSPELLALKSELEQAREQLKHDKATMQHTEAQWNARLQEEMEANKELRHRLSEQTNEMASLMRQLTDLKLALRQTQTALNNNIYHPARIQGGGADNSIHNASLPLADDMYIDTSLHRTTIDPELLLAESGRYQPPLDDSISSDDLSSQGDSMAIIEQTKARFRELEREAEHLEQNYQDLQHRMSGVGGLYRSPLPAGGGTPGGAKLHPSLGLTRSGLPEHGTDLPVDGGRHHYRDAPVGSPSSSKYPRRHAAGQKQSEPVRSGAYSRKYTGGKSQSDPVETGAYQLTGSLEEVFNDDERDAGHSMSDQRNTESLIPGKLPLSPLSSSSSSTSVSKGLRESDLRADGHGAGYPGIESSPDERRRLEDESRMRDRRIKDQNRMKEEEEEEEERRRRDGKQKDEEERRRYQEEMREEERRKEEDRKREEERREDDRRREEEERRRREEQEQRTDADEEERRRRVEEEEEEQRAWEEKRRQKEEERRRKDLEAREREQRMLMELQKQEHGATATTPMTTTGTDQDLPKDGAGQREQEGQKEGGGEDEKEEDKEKEEEEGIKIDPVMQRYMLMVQKRKKEQETATTPATPPPEPEVIPDSPSLSVKSDGTFSVGEMDRVDDPASGGNVSDKDDPFDDW